jgi:opacity protein-like surface antigen
MSLHRERLRLILALALGLAVIPAESRAREITISPMAGYTTPGGFEVGQADLDIKLKGGLTWGGQLGFVPHDGFAFEVSYMQQESHIAVGSTDLLGIKVGQLHGNFIFEKIRYGTKTRPYFLLGAGATFFNPDGGLEGESRFSFALGAGVKTKMSEKLGFKIQGKYNPTYISSDWGSTWCDPFYGCYQVADPDYLDQGEFTAGLIYKLGQ